MPDFTKSSVASQKPVDKVVYTLTGSFTYTFTTSNSGGLVVLSNPEPGVIFLTESIFSRDGGVTWFGDLDGSQFLTTPTPDINTICTLSSVLFRYGSFGPSGSFTIQYRTRLLAVS